MDLIAKMAEEVLPVGLFLEQLFAGLAITLGLAAGVDHHEQALGRQFIQIPQHGPPPGGLGTRAIAGGSSGPKVGR